MSKGEHKSAVNELADRPIEAPTLGSGVEQCPECSPRRDDHALELSPARLRSGQALGPLPRGWQGQVFWRERLCDLPYRGQYGFGKSVRCCRQPGRPRGDRPYEKSC